MKNKTKFKNPYYDITIDKKSVYHLQNILNDKGISLQDKFAGLFIRDNIICVLETHLDYEMCIYQELSIYEAMPELIPDGLVYDKESDKLVNNCCTYEVVSYADEILSSISNVPNNPNFRDYNVGSSDYAKRKIQPWDIWEEYALDPWDADIIKRVLRKKEGDNPTLDYQKIKHICDKKIDMLKNK